MSSELLSAALPLVDLADNPPGLEELIEEMLAGWDAGEPADALAFLQRYPELLQNREIVLDLAAEEFAYRVQRGESPSAEEFAARFPAYQNSLCSMVLANHFVQSEEPGLLLQVEKKEPEEKEINWPRVGEKFLDFQLLRELGRGGLGRVFLAEQTNLRNRVVVVKLSPRGELEAGILAGLAHQNVVPIYSVHKDANTKLTAVCMPFRGQATLNHVLDRAFQGPGAPAHGRVILEASAIAEELEPFLEQGVQPDPVLLHGTYVEWVIHLGIQMAQALGFVHSRQILHRDLKPSNVLLSPAGQPLLLDFNVSLDERNNDGSGGGTVAYMAPEQLEGLRIRQENKAKKSPADLPDGSTVEYAPPPACPPLPALDARTDLYAVGIILFQLLTGKHPHGPIPWTGKAEEQRRYFAERQLRPLPSIQEALPNEPRSALLEAVVRRCLALRPQDRFASAAELETALRGCLHPPTAGWAG